MVIPNIDFQASGSVLHTVFPFVCTHFNKKLYIFPIFPAKYKEMRPFHTTACPQKDHA